MSEAVIKAIKTYAEHHPEADPLASEVQIEQWITAFHEWKDIIYDIATAAWTPDHPKDYESAKGVKFPSELADIIYDIVKAENADRINRLIAKGFTMDGILAASIDCESIGYAVLRAEQIAAGTWR
jgi:hypothetical protein